MLGAWNSASSRRPASWPARNCSPSGDRPMRPVPGQHALGGPVPQRQVDVAGVALLVVRLGHERDAHAVGGGDLLRAGLVDRVVIAGGDRAGVAERDLVLAQVALALRRLDVHAGARHAQPDLAQQRLDPRGAEDGVVDVVLVRGGEVAPAAGLGLLVGVVVDDELQLGAGAARSSRARPAASPGPGGSGGARRPPGCRPPRPDRRSPGRTPPATAAAASWPARARGRSPRTRAPTRTWRTRRPCSSRRPPRGGSCSPPRGGGSPRQGRTRRTGACPAGAPACR